MQFVVAKLQSQLAGHITLCTRHPLMENGMDIQPKELRELLGNIQVTEPLRMNHGKCIAVLEKGFVYVGNVSTENGWVVISNAENIRKWAGGHGLSWYAKNGFAKDIILDVSGEIRCPVTELKHLILCEDVG